MNVHFAHFYYLCVLFQFPVLLLACNKTLEKFHFAQTKDEKSYFDILHLYCDFDSSR